MKKLICIVLCVIMYVSCTQDSDVDYLSQEGNFEHILTDAEKSWVEELSTKRVGRLDPIVIRFTKDLDEQNLAQAIAVSSEIEGSLKALDTRTIEFVPSKAYKSNSKISVTISLKELFTGVSDEEILDIANGDLTFEFFADYPSYSVDFAGMSIDNNGNYILKGSLKTDIPLTYNEVNKVISAELEQGNRSSKKKVSWDEQGSLDSRDFSVSIDNKVDVDRTLLITWAGTSLGISKEADAGFSSSRSFFVPKEGAFEVVNIDSSNAEYVSIDFSEALDLSQDLRGFLRVETTNGSVATQKVRYQLTSNNVKIYNDSGWEDAISLTVNEGISSASGRILASSTSVALSDDWDTPAIRFPSTEGVILPTTHGSTLAIETRNLTGVIVEAFHISGDSILQFLQVNNLNGERELDRVGEPIWTKAFDITWDNSMQNEYITHGVDLTELIKKYPDGMFQIRLTFRHRHIMYKCSEGHEDFSDLVMPADDEIITYQSHTPYWESSNSYRNTYSYRNDPCHPNFYRYSSNRSVVAKRNVLVSDIGVMAKLSSDDKWYITAADLRTTESIANASVTMYSYVGKPIAEGKTNNDGSIILTAESPAFIVVSNETQSSYLKLSTSTALSVSHFNIGGEKPINGVKGFIYGERGVWRPGDDIFLTFILDDKNKQFPTNFPITFELSDPSGKITDSKIIQAPVDGFYAIATNTLEDSKTGNWTARVKAGGQQWQKTIKVETVVPNRLSIDLDIGGSYLKRSNNDVTLTGAWLHGAPIPNYKAEIDAYFYSAPTLFTGYNDYVFSDFGRTVSSSKQDIWEGNLDENSQAFIDLDFDNRANYPGKMRVQMVSTIYEPSGMFSKEQALFDYEPYDTYVGLKLPKGDRSRGMLLTDVDHTGEVVVLTPEGKPASNTTLEYTVHKLEWKWWWEKDALTDASYAGSRYNREVDAGTFTSNNGVGRFNFKVEHPDWGRYLVTVTDVKGGHSSSKVVYIDWPGWAGRSSGDDSGSASMLTLTQDKETYISGESAVITFPSNTSGRALVTVEKNGIIVKQDWLETQDTTTAYNLALTDEYAPNVYVHVTLVQPHLQTENSLPIRLYGVIPILVEDPMTRLQPVIATPSSYEPNKEATVTVSERNGRPMTFTLAVVEEGLLGLTRFRTEDPWNEFYKKEASQLFSWDVYSSVINAFSGKLETLLAIGGGEGAAENPDASNMRFKPVVKYFGPYELPANGKREITFEMPEYVGSVRAMVVAGKEGSYGVAESTVPVKSDLMILPSLPRTLGSQESLRIPVTVFNGTNLQQTVNVQFSSKGAISMSDRTSIQVGASSEKIVYFNVNTADIGWSDITVNATMGNASASNTTSIETVSRGIPVFAAEKAIINPGSRERFNLELSAEQSSLSFMVELSSLPPIDVSGRLSYLVRYPHGCIEQITSAGFPQLYIPDFVNSNAEEIEDIKKNIQAVIDKYPSYQTASGGFSYWPGGSTPHGWGSSYAGHFMIEAKKAGYTIPDSLYNSWLSWQKQQAGQWTSSSVQSAQTQAYRLYTLALAGEGDIGAMNRLKSFEYSGSTETLMLAAAYAVLGHKNTALQVLDNLDDDISEYRHTGGTFASSTRDIAMRLYVHNLLGEKRKLAKDIEEISEIMSSKKWLTTQEISWSFISLLPYYKGTDYQEITYEIQQNGNTITDSFIGGSKTVQLVPSDNENHIVVVRNTGDGPLYVKALVEGDSIPGTETLKNTGLELNVSYYDESGIRINPSTLNVGDNFSIRVSVENLDTYYDVENIALTLPIPTGWEIFNERIASSTSASSATFDYQDLRDNAIYTYFSLDSSDDKTFNFSGTVTQEGGYSIPAVFVEAMYDDSYSAVYPGIGNVTR